MVPTNNMTLYIARNVITHFGIPQNARLTKWLIYHMQFILLWVLRALQICATSFTACAFYCRPSGTLGLLSLELPFWESTQRMVSTISRPVHAAFCKCGCYSAPGNSTSTSHCHLPQASHVLICLADLLCLFPCYFVLRDSHLVRNLFACRQVQQACGCLGLKQG